MSQVTKNQHFVPQSLIKHFCRHDSLVSVFDSKRNISRPPTTVKRVLSENYFYDEDNSIENFLAEHVEAPAAPIFREIASNPHKSINCNEIDLLRFVTVQLNRTPRALSCALEIIDNFTGMLIKEIGKLNNFDENTTNEIKLVLNNPKALLGRQTVGGALNWPLIKDLEWHVLINNTDIDFVLSDHPVVHYNWYLRDSNELGYTSLTSCGLQIFLPVSHGVTICFYDKAIYKMGEKNSNYTVIVEKNDIFLLNELQFRSREAFIVYSSADQSSYVINECEKFPESSLYQNRSWSSGVVMAENENLKSTQVVFRTQIKINKWLSFCKIKRRVTKRKIECYDRDPQIVERHKMFMKEINGSNKINGVGLD